MTPTASPRHPWKALAVVLSMAAAVHGARAHVGGDRHGFTHGVVADGAPAHRDCPDVFAADDGDDPLVDLCDAVDADAADGLDESAAPRRARPRFAAPIRGLVPSRRVPVARPRKITPPLSTPRRTEFP